MRTRRFSLSLLVTTTVLTVFLSYRAQAQCIPSVVQILPIPEVITSHQGSGLGFGSGYLWATTVHPDSKVYKVDPKNGEIVGSYDQSHYTPGVSNVHSLAFDRVNRLIYNYFYPYGPFYVVDATTFGELRTFAAPGSWIHDITFDDANQILWAVRADSIGNNFIVYKLDPSDGTVLGSFTTPTNAGCPEGLTWDGNSLWITESADGYLYQIDSDQAIADGNCSNAILQKLYLATIGVPFTGRLAFDPTSLWTSKSPNAFFIGWMFVSPNQPRISKPTAKMVL